MMTRGIVQFNPDRVTGSHNRDIYLTILLPKCG